MKPVAIALSVLALSLAACSSPLTIPKAPAFQAKTTHTNDWSSLAERSASHFAQTRGTGAVYVAPGPADMPFASAYRMMLEEKLLQRHVRVTESPAGAAVLRFDVRTYWYRDSHHKLPGDYASFWTSAGALGTQLRDITSIDTGVAAGVGAGPAFDILMSMFEGTKAEATVTLSVFDGEQLSYRDSETIYIRPQELPFYWTRLSDFMPQAKSAPAADVLLRVRDGRR
jgi:hypothetical protein